MADRFPYKNVSADFLKTDFFIVLYSFGSFKRKYLEVLVSYVFNNCYMPTVTLYLH